MAELSKSNEAYPDYPIFKGLQRPLEFMGIQGRYIYWAAGSAGAAVVGFIVGYIVAGFVVGLVLVVISLSIGIGLIFIKQRKGLHTKNALGGEFIYSHSKKM